MASPSLTRSQYSSRVGECSDGAVRVRVYATSRLIMALTDQVVNNVDLSIYPTFFVLSLKSQP